MKPFLETTEDEWRDLLAVNLFGYVWGCRAAAHAAWSPPVAGASSMSARPRTCSRSPTSPPTSPPRAASSGSRGRSPSSSRHTGSRSTRIAPGATDTPLNATSYTPEVRAAYEKRISLGHIASPAEIGDAAVFLASDASRYITGHELLVDGGLTINGSVGHART